MFVLEDSETKVIDVWGINASIKLEETRLIDRPL